MRFLAIASLGGGGIDTFVNCELPPGLPPSGRDEGARALGPPAIAGKEVV
ncbi:MAG: hypothetical protein WEB00_13490 [Dehalococcoidia bacterium]